MLNDIPTAMRHIVRATLETIRLRSDAYEQVEHQARAEIAQSISRNRKVHRSQNPYYSPGAGTSYSL